MLLHVLTVTGHSSFKLYLSRLNLLAVAERGILWSTEPGEDCDAYRDTVDSLVLEMAKYTDILQYVTEGAINHPMPKLYNNETLFRRSRFISENSDEPSTVSHERVYWIGSAWTLGGDGW